MGLASIETAREKANGAAAADVGSRLLAHLTLEEGPGKRLRLTRIGPRHWRVNVYAEAAEASDMLAVFRPLPAFRTWCIVKSQFLHVEDHHGELVITDQTQR